MKGTRSAKDLHVFFVVTVIDTLVLVKPVADEFIRRGWRCTIVAGVKEAGMQVDHRGYDVIDLNMPRTVDPVGDVRTIHALTKLMREQRPLVVVGSTPKGSLLSMISARLAGVPVRVLQVRGARWEGQTGALAHLLQMADRTSALNATAVLAVSDSLAELLLEARITRRRPQVLGSGGSKGVDLARFKPRAKGVARPPTLGFVGRFSEDKGVEVVLSVHDYCMARDPRTRLLLVGPLDPVQPPGERTVQRMRGRNVDWLGYLPDPSEAFPLFDVLVFPSQREGLPNAVIEAAACGVPTVGYRTTGVRDAVVEGSTGLLVPLGDRDLLAEAAWSILSGDRTTMSSNCIRFAQENFSEDRVVGLFVDFVQECVDQLHQK